MCGEVFFIVPFWADSKTSNHWDTVESRGGMEDENNQH